MKFLITNGHLNVGGGEKSLLNLLNNIDYTKHQVDLLLFEELGDYYQLLPPAVNVTLFDLHPTYGSLKQIFLRFIKTGHFKDLLLKIVLILYGRVHKKFIILFKCFMKNQFSYDCAIAYRIGICTDFVSYAVKAPKKMMWWHHGEFNYDENTVKKWLRVLNNINNIVCVSKSSFDLILPHFYYYKERMYVLPNMIITNEIISKGQEFNPYEKINKKIFKIVSVGRLSPEKHMGDAVEAVRMLKDRGYDYIIWFLVGDGIEMENIKQRIVYYHLGNEIVMVGNQSNPYPYINYADLFVHLSYVESQGITVLEAMALNKLSVVTRSMGTDEFVVDGVNALKAEQNVTSLVEKIVLAMSLQDNISSYKREQDKTVDKYQPKAIMSMFYDLVD